MKRNTLSGQLSLLMFLLICILFVQRIQFWLEDLISISFIPTESTDINCLYRCRFNTLGHSRSI